MPDKRGGPLARLTGGEATDERRTSSLHRTANAAVRRPNFVNGASDRDGRQQVCINNANWVQLEITGNVTNLSIELWKFTQLTHLYLNDNSLSSLAPELSRLSKLEVLDVSHNKLQSLPAEIGDVMTLRELLLNNNLLRMLPLEMGRLFQLSTLTLSGNPLLPEIMGIFETQGTQKLIQFYQDQLVRQLPPMDARSWQRLDNQDNSRTTGLILCMCYNILCDQYANTKTYAYCPAWALEWDTRKVRILEEIRSYQADIVALQEVETEPFNTYFLPELRNDGYEGIFQPKSRARTMVDSDAKHVDGCALFYRQSRFKVVREKAVEFNQIAIQSHEGIPDMLNRVMPRDNIAQLVLFEPREDFLEPEMLRHFPLSKLQRHKVLVVNAHIHWDPTYSDVKIVQTIMLVHEIRQFILELYRDGVTREMYTHLQAARGSGDLSNEQIVQAMPIIMCGDFNSIADSAVVQYLMNGRVHTSHEDFRATGYEPALVKMSTSTRELDTITHDLRLANAYANQNANEPPYMLFTNYTYTFRDIIDYVLYSSSEQQYAALRVLGVLCGPDPSWFETWKVAGCPQPSVPSDHFPLVVEFELALRGGAQLDAGAQRRTPNAMGYSGGNGSTAYSGPAPGGAMHGYHHPPQHYRSGGSRAYKS